jgi:hypothetical protein
MEYVIPVVLVVLLIGGLITFLVLNATRKSSPAGGHEGAPGMGGDRTPLGDTSEHAGEQTEQGTTATDPEGDLSRRTDPDAAAHVGRPGEGEGAERFRFDGEQPRRVADRDS